MLVCEFINVGGIMRSVCWRAITGSGVNWHISNWEGRVTLLIRHIVLCHSCLKAINTLREPRPKQCYYLCAPLTVDNFIQLIN